MVTLLGSKPDDALDPRHERPWRAVPWRTIIASTIVVGSTLLLAIIVIAAARVITWIAIAGFFAIVLSPVVTRVERRLGGRRALAKLVVMLAALVVIAGFVALFVFPLRHQIAAIVSDLPGTVDSAVHGRGPVGNVVQKLHLQNLARDHQRELKRWADDLSKSSFHYAQIVAEGALEFVTILVITFFFLSQARIIGRATNDIIPPHRREAVRKVGVDASSAISGYMLGNLLISLIAGVAAFVMLVAARVPNAAALAAWVAFTDLIPLVGATLGAVAVVIAAFLHSTTAGVIAIVFFVVYQQFENSVLQPTVMARTVNINPLTVLLSVLIGVAVFGYWGALLAIPVAGSIQVIVTAAWHEWQRERLEIASLATADDTEPAD